jgi:phosphatidylethanolamine-binding protein (PEBP) family uncharacterized protein
MACALEVPGSGPALTHDGQDAVAMGAPIEDPPGAPPGSSSVAVTTPSAVNGSTAPVNPSVAGDDAGVVRVDADGGASAPPLAPISDAGVATPPVTPIDPGKPGGFKLTSTAFDDGARLPAAFTCAGVSPPLAWINSPPETKTFALVLTAKTAAKSSASPSVEWVVWGIPAARMGLPQGVAAGSQPSNVPGARQDARDDEGSSGSTGGGFGTVAGSGFTGGFGTVAGTGFTGGFGTVAGSGFTAGFGTPAGASFGGSWGGGAVGVPGAGVPAYPSDSATPPRYHGPCGSSPISLEFTLFALDAAQSAQWGSFVSVETVTQWLKTGGDVLAHASLSATAP